MKISNFKPIIGKGLACAAAVFLTVGMAYAAEIKVAIVLPGVITDRSFTQAGFKGVERAAKELSIEFAYSEKTA